uniref:Uncharacterized protein MANES_10G075800 n=1 Tax=Rhizophora mucronata TaxID=61149 RepID=A0A2P2NJ87_RHIMU
MHVRYCEVVPTMQLSTRLTIQDRPLLFCKGKNLQLYKGPEFFQQLLYALETGQRGEINVDYEDLGPENLVPIP